jgi:hypothetical protein
LKLHELFNDKHPSDVYFTHLALEHIKQVGQEFDFVTYHLHGGKIVDDNTFWKEASIALNFPDYFGENWDAFADLLRDFSWGETVNIIIYYDEVENLAQNAPYTFYIAYRHFKTIAEDTDDIGKIYMFMNGDIESLPPQIKDIYIVD